MSGTNNYLFSLKYIGGKFKELSSFKFCVSPCHLLRIVPVCLHWSKAIVCMNSLVATLGLTIVFDFFQLIADAVVLIAPHFAEHDHWMLLKFMVSTLFRFDS